MLWSTPIWVARMLPKQTLVSHLYTALPIQHSSSENFLDSNPYSYQKRAFSNNSLTGDIIRHTETLCLSSFAKPQGSRTGVRNFLGHKSTPQHPSPSSRMLYFAPSNATPTYPHHQELLFPVANGYEEREKFSDVGEWRLQ